MNVPTLDAGSLQSAVARALAEDLGTAGDLTTAAVIPDDAKACGHFVAREHLVVAGIVAAREVFAQLDRTVEFTAIREDGERAGGGDRLATVRGAARRILEGERTALNFLMRMSGIATMARGAVEEIEGTGATILDTRKTAPGLRAIDKYAVAAGGAVNHRAGLFDAVMIKDTHLAVAPGLCASIRRAVATGLAPERITAEVRTLDQLDEAIEAGAGRALLDNMGLDMLREAVRRAKGRIVLEASGGLAPGKLRAVAETGVDYLSLGALTHSVRAADIALEMEETS
jgi:nicotinate-nucleotide pyrophosphorylase (carboxylating)